MPCDAISDDLLEALEVIHANRPIGRTVIADDGLRDVQCFVIGQHTLYSCMEGGSIDVIDGRWG